MEISRRLLGLVCDHGVFRLSMSVARPSPACTTRPTMERHRSSRWRTHRMKNLSAQAVSGQSRQQCGTCSTCGCRRAACGCQPPAPWSLPQPCLLQRTGFKLGGWLEQGITFNDHHSD